MLRKSVYPKVESLLNRIASNLNQKGFTPNQLTLAGLAINLVAGVIYASGHFFIAAVVTLIAALGDLLDGPLARTSGKVTKFGAFLDSTVDRYSDFFLFGGVALFFAKNDESFWFVMTLMVIAGSFVTSYSKARAENLIENCSAGLFERAERIIVLCLGSLIWPLLTTAIFILAIGTNATAIHRILFTRKVLSQNTDK